MTDPKFNPNTAQTALGIEFGSTRVKAVLIADDCSVLAEGVYPWENRFENGHWTYDEAQIRAALRGCYAALREEVQSRYGFALQKIGAIGISAMMHGYIALDQNDRLLVPFRTWRNTNTTEAAAALTEKLGFHIPERWSIAHLYQAALNGEVHLPALAHLTTLAGYVHFLLTGERVLGAGDASGMFPLSGETGDYDEAMLKTCGALLCEKGVWQDLKTLLPRVLRAGEPAGVLTEAGAKLLDETGVLQSAIPFCPPEGDAGTGMVATNSIRPKTGNVSAGTSVFAMAVLDKPLRRVHTALDLVATPWGDPVAMVHCNNCTAEIDAWASLLDEFAGRLGADSSKSDVFSVLYRAALEADPDCGGLLSFNFLSGEPIAALPNGVPLFLRRPGSRMTFCNFAGNLLYAALCTLRMGMEILAEEDVLPERMIGHGGFFKTEQAGQAAMAAALALPVTVMQTAQMGGPWGMAVLALYALQGADLPLAEYLEKRVFQSAPQSTLQPTKQAMDGFNAYYAAWKRALEVEKAAAGLAAEEA